MRRFLIRFGSFAGLAVLAICSCVMPPVILPPLLGARIVYRLNGGHLFRLAAQEGAVPEDLSAALDRLATGTQDDWINCSPNGEWLLASTDRFDPGSVGYASLAVIRGDVSSAESVRSNGDLVHPDGFGAISSDGNTIVYPQNGGPHGTDLYAITRSGAGWSAPQLLTAASPYQFNAQPALSANGRTLLFDGGNVQYAGAGTAICEVGVDGAGLRVVLTPANNPPGLPPGGALHHADYAHDGSIVFEGDWDGERIWRLPAGGGAPTKVAPDQSNDNSPCVLGDGRIVSLWLGRAGNALGVHELKVMTADGGSFFTPLANMDVADIGIGCGN